MVVHNFFPERGGGDKRVLLPALGFAAWVNVVDSWLGFPLPRRPLPSIGADMQHGLRLRAALLVGEGRLVRPAFDRLRCVPGASSEEGEPEPKRRVALLLTRGGSNGRHYEKAEVDYLAPAE